MEELLRVLLFIGDDWAEDHHDLEIEDETGRRLAKARLPEGLEGISRLHALVAEHAPAEWAELPSEEVASRVFVGIETDRGPWVTALRRPATRCWRSTRCPRRDIGSGTPPPAPKATRVMRTFWRRSSGWIVIITGRSPGTPIWWTR